MGSLLGQVLPLAAGAAISPAVLTVQLLTLAKGGDATKRSWLIALGAGVVLAGLSVVALSLAAGTGGSGTPPAWRSAVKLAAAVALLVFGVRNLTRPPKPPKKDSTPTTGGAGRAVGLGMVLMATNVTTLALFFPAVHEISTEKDVELGGQLLVFAIVYAITMLPAFAPPLLVTVSGERGQRGLVNLNDFVTAHHQQINATVCFLFALVLGVPALRELL